MDNETGQTVEVYIYDLTQGMASVMSQMLLGRQLDGIWHTGIVVFGKEYFFGGQGIQSCPPGGTVLGSPLKKEKIGQTFIPYQIFKDYIRGLAEGPFRGANYNLLRHNCNTFSEDLSVFLCGSSIPKYILDLPHEFLQTPLGQSIGPLIESISAGNRNSATGSEHFSFEPQIAGIRQTSPGFDEINTEIEEARLKSLRLDEKRQALHTKLGKKDKKKEKKRKKTQQQQEEEGNYNNNSNSDYSSSNNNNNNCETTMSEVESEINGDGGHIPIIPSEMLPSEQAFEDEARERAEEEERRKNREPPIVFHNIDPKVELEAFVKLIDGKISPEEEQNIEELHQYLIHGEGSWALGDGFLVFVGRILSNKEISMETRVHLLRALACCALKDDVILLLHQDRRDHTIMNYAQDIDRHAPEEQQALALFMCNLFENVSSSEWTLYISEWTYNNSQTSNIRATTKVAVHSLLTSCPTLQDIGSAIIYNLACKEVFDDVAVELAMALLQFFNCKPSEEHLFRTMKALAKFVTVSPDIPQLVQMIGPHPNTFKGTSSRVDDLIDIISKKVR